MVLHWASPASPIDYLELPIPTLKVGALGTHKALGLAKAKGARVRPRLDFRGLRRSARASAERKLLGQRQPDWPARRLRRGQAVRRSDDDGLSPLSRASIRRSCGSSTPTGRACGSRRPRRPRVHIAGAARRRHHGLRRRQADPQLLLRQRSGRRHFAADGVGSARAGQYRQPARDDDRGDRAEHSGDGRFEEPDHLPAAAGGRSRKCVNRTSRGRGRSLAGSRRFRSTRASAERWPTSARPSAASAGFRDRSRYRAGSACGRPGRRGDRRPPDPATGS